MELKEIISKLDGALPRAWAEEWDNVGLLIGGPEDVSRIAVALDATPCSIERATQLGCGLLVTHHPVIFRPIREIASEGLAQSAARAAIRLGVGIWSAHTNWDSAPDGVNETLAVLLGLEDISPLVPGREGAFGMGAVGSLAAPMTIGELAARAKIAWSLPHVKIHGRASKEVRRAALCGGAGADLIEIASRAGADVYITADVRHHEALEASHIGLALIEPDHGAMESASLDALAALVSRVAGVGVEIIRSEHEITSI